MASLSNTALSAAPLVGRAASSSLGTLMYACVNVDLLLLRCCLDGTVQWQGIFKCVGSQEALFLLYTTMYACKGMSCYRVVQVTSDFSKNELRHDSYC